MKNNELHREKNELESERKRYVELFDLAPVGYLAINAAGLIRNANLAVVTMLGVSRNSLLNKQVVQFIYAEDREIYTLQRKQCFESNTPQAWEMRLVRGSGTPLWALLQATPARNGEYWITLQDITVKKQVDAYADMGREVAQTLLAPLSRHDSMQRVLEVLKTSTGFDAVGIRLQDGEDFPYFVQNGFSADFLLTENTLIERSADGGICRDTDGTVSLECTCGLVISGKTNPDNPLFTKGGSCWTNDSFPLLALPPDRDPRLHPRNQCIHQNYASVALIPIRAKDKILGLIQFNDRRKGCFTLEIIELLEGVAKLLGESIMRKRLEEAQIRNEKILKNVQQITHVGSWYLDVATNQVVWTEELYNMYGFDPALPPPPYTEHQKLFTPESWEMLSSSLAATRDTGVPYELELKTLRGDGHSGWMWVRGEAVLDNSGKTVALWGAAQDITTQKETENALRETNEYLDNLFNYANAPIIVWDTGFRITRFNRAFERLTGLSAVEVIGSDISTLFPRDQIDSSMALIKDTLSGERWETVEIPILHVNGTVSIVLWNSANIYATDGTSPLATIAQGHDITTRKHVEQELQDKNREMERFVYTVSQDLKSPLITIQAFASMIAKNMDSGRYERARDDIQRIEGAAGKMTDLLNDLLELSRVGRQMNEPIQVD